MGDWSMPGVCPRPESVVPVARIAARLGGVGPEEGPAFRVGPARVLHELLEIVLGRTR